MKKLRYLDESKLDEIKKVSKVYEKKDILNHEDINVRENFYDFDFLIEVDNFDTIINNSILKIELEKISKFKILFEEMNEAMLKEKTIGESNELEETSDREILNRNLVNNLRRRGINFTNQDNIYFKNQEDESYNNIRSYYLDITMSYQFNRDFYAIAKGLRKAIVSSKQDFTFFKGISTFSDNNYKYVVIIKDFYFNNEKFTKNIYKLFLPYLTLTCVEIAMANIKVSNSWRQCAYSIVNNSRNQNIMTLKGF